MLGIITRLVVTQATNAALLGLILYLRSLSSRFPATVTALFGCDLIITVCFAALVPLVNVLGEGGSSRRASSCSLKVSCEYRLARE